MLRAGETTAEALYEEACERHSRYGATLGAYITWDPDGARATARAADMAFRCGSDLGPLQGLPVSVKDIYGIKGLPVFAGSPKRLPSKWETEGTIVTCVRRQLGVFTGKTHTVEFAFGGLGVNRHWDEPVNPWGLPGQRIPGGSSSGAGVSLSEGSALIALAGDTAGSVRIPASVTGNVGLKTSAGRWPKDGVVPLSETFDTLGVLTRTAEDVAFAFSAIETGFGSRAEPPIAVGRGEVAGLRLGICERFFWDECSPGVVEGVKDALDELAAKGALVVAAELPEVDGAYAMFQKGGLVAAEFCAFLSAELPEWFDTLDPNVKARAMDGQNLPAVKYLRRARELARLGASADARLAAVDFVVTPTVAITPPTFVEVEDSGAYRRCNMLTLRNTSVVSLLGLCALTLPVALDRTGMPVGLQLISRRGSEPRLIAAAIAIESVLGCARRRLGEPPLDGARAPSSDRRLRPRRGCGRAWQPELSRTSPAGAGFNERREEKTWTNALKPRRKT